MATYPLPTLACTIGPAGITAPALQDIINSMIASFTAIYGTDVLLTPDTQDYQWIAVMATAQNDTNMATIATYNNMSPNYAVGAGLSSMVKINGIRRQSGTNSTAIVTLVGVVGTVIPNGVVQDENGNLWDLPASVTIPPAGQIDETVTAEQLGDIIAPAGTINIRYTVVQGWQSVTNVAAALPGSPVESDAELRARQTISTSLPALTPLEAIAGAVANVAGVTRSIVYENQYPEPDANGIPGHSIAVVVAGGDINAVAQAIESKKSPGTGTYGTTTVTVLDPAGVPIPISFFELAEQAIYVSVTIKPLDGYVNSTAAAIVTAICDLINSLPIGQTVYYPWVGGAAQLSGQPLSMTFAMATLQIGLSPGSLGQVDIPISFDAAAVCNPSDVTFGVVP